MKKIILFFIAALFFAACNCGQHTKMPKCDDAFSFVFMTDIHIDTSKVSHAGFAKTIDTINTMELDFVLTGGDQVMDALNKTKAHAEKLYGIYDEMSSQIAVPVHNTIGNHELYGVYDTTGKTREESYYGLGMYEEKIGKPYYHFEHKGWHFISLNSIETEGFRYYGGIDSAQMIWLKKTLQQIPEDAPIVVSTHIPFLTVWTELYFEDALKANPDGVVVTNAIEVLKMFEGHNLKLVLQGHLHYYEDIFVMGTHFITAGAVSAHWWQGPHMGTEEGFLKVDVCGNDCSWEYVDINWSPNN